MSELVLDACGERVVMRRIAGGMSWKLSRRIKRRPTLEIHVPISPTTSFINQIRCLTHSLRRFGGAYRSAPVVVTVGDESVDFALAERMPWLAANGIELRWVPAENYAKLSYFATVSERLKHRFCSDVVLLLDADTLIRRPLDPLIQAVHRERAVAGCIAHVTPLTSGKLDRPSWSQLFELCGLKAPRLDFEHTGWGYMFADAAYRFCPAYFNFGVVAAPASMMSTIGAVFESRLIRLRDVMGSYYDAQLALAISIAELGYPARGLPLRYNMANNPLLEALHHREIEPAVILHLLAEQHFHRVETFASLASLEAFVARRDLCLVSRMAQQIIREILPDLVAEEQTYKAGAA
jgi:hypothetical protein